MDDNKDNAGDVFTKPVVNRMSKIKGVKSISDVFYLRFITYITEIIKELVLQAESIATKNGRNTVIAKDFEEATEELYGRDFYEGSAELSNDKVFLRKLGLQELVHVISSNSNYRFQSTGMNLLAKVLSSYSYDIFAKANDNILSEKRVIALDRDLAYAKSQIEQTEYVDGNTNSTPNISSPKEKAKYTRAQLEKHTVIELKKIYVDMNIGKYNNKTMSSMKKAELINAVYNSQ